MSTPLDNLLKKRGEGYGADTEEEESYTFFDDFPPVRSSALNYLFQSPLPPEGEEDEDGAE
jgi:hypothetical protein